MRQEGWTDVPSRSSGEIPRGMRRLAGVAKRLITEEQVHAIVGCHQSTLTEIVAEVCEEYHIPMITAISTVDSISTHHNEYFFRLCPMNSLYLEICSCT